MTSHSRGSSHVSTPGSTQQSSPSQIAPQSMGVASHRWPAHGCSESWTCAPFAPPPGAHSVHSANASKARLPLPSLTPPHPLLPAPLCLSPSLAPPRHPSALARPSLALPRTASPPRSFKEGTYIDAAALKLILFTMLPKRECKKRLFSEPAPPSLAPPHPRALTLPAAPC